MGKSLGEGLRGFKDSISGDAATAHLAEAHVPVVTEETPVQVIHVNAEPVAKPTPMRPTA
jgi:hypothetical protein